MAGLYHDGVSKERFYRENRQSASGLDPEVLHGLSARVLAGSRCSLGTPEIRLSDTYLPFIS